MSFTQGFFKQGLDEIQRGEGHITRASDGAPVAAVRDRRVYDVRSPEGRVAGSSFTQVAAPSPPVAVEMSETALLYDMRQYGSRFLELAQGSDKVAAHDALREYRKRATAMEVSGEADQIRMLQSTLARTHPDMVAELGQLLPENLVRQANRLGIDPGSFDRTTDRNYYMGRGASPEFADLMSGFYGGGFSGDPASASRAARAAKFFSENPGDLPAAERMFQASETSIERVLPGIRSEGLSEGESRDAAVAATETRRLTGLSEEAVSAVFRTAYETEVGRLAPADGPPATLETKALAAQHARNLFAGVNHAVQQSPEIAEAIHDAFTNFGGLELDYERVSLQTPGGVSAKLTEFGKATSAARERARGLVKANILTEEEALQWRAEMMYRNAPPNFFKINPSLEQASTLGGDKLQTLHASSGWMRTAEAAHETGDARTRDSALLRHNLSIAATDAGRKQIASVWEQQGMGKDDIAHNVLLLQNVAALGDVAVAPPGKMLEMASKYRRSRIHSDGVQSPAQLQLAEEELRDLANQLTSRAQARGMDPNDLGVDVVNDLRRQVRSGVEKAQTAARAPEGGVDEIVDSHMRNLFPLEMDKPVGQRTQAAARAERTVRKSLERARDPRVLSRPVAVLSNATVSALLKSTYTKDPGVTNRRLAESLGKVDLSNPGMKIRGAPVGMALESLYKAEDLVQLSRMDEVVRVTSLLRDLESRGFIRVEPQVDGSPAQYVWNESPDGGITAREGGSFLESEGGEAVSTGFAYRVGETQYDISDPQQWKALLLASTPQSEHPWLESSIRLNRERADKYFVAADAYMELDARGALPTGEQFLKGAPASETARQDLLLAAMTPAQRKEASTSERERRKYEHELRVKELDRRSRLEELDRKLKTEVLTARIRAEMEAERNRLRAAQSLVRGDDPDLDAMEYLRTFFRGDDLELD